MPAFLFNERTRDKYYAALNRISANDAPRWGFLTPVALMRHLRLAFEASTGEAPMPDKSTFFSRHVIPPMILYFKTDWPRGKIKAPDFFTPPPEHDLAQERDLLFQKGDEFLVKLRTAPHEKHAHSFFGPLTVSYWSRVHGTHLRHHLR